MDQVISTPAAIIKREGERVPFDAEKIRYAIERAGAASGEYDATEALLLTAQTVKVLQHRFRDGAVDIEQIQDVVEQALNVCQTTVVQDAWQRGQEIVVHGWVYGIGNGLLEDLEMSVGRLDDAAPVLLYAARKAEADILVAGAFGHPRLQEFIFGGTTRTLLNSDQPSLFLSH